jgi:hypothetical protein
MSIQKCLFIASILIIGFGCSTTSNKLDGGGPRIPSQLPVSLTCMELFSSVAALRDFKYDEITTETIKHFDKDIHIGQYHYGVPGVKNRIRDFLKNADHKKRLKKMLKDRPIPFVRGPDGKKWIVDRHHFSRALYESRAELKKRGVKIHKVKVYFQEIILNDGERLSHLSIEEFEEAMLRRKLIYPFLDGEYRSIQFMPSHVSELKPDFYRGLAWVLRKGGAFEKTGVPYEEFFWASYFQKVLDFKKLKFSKKRVRKAIITALKETDETNKLPGFLRIGLSRSERKEMADSIIDKIEEDELLTF